MTPEQFLKGLTGESLAYAENLQAQRDSSIVSLATADADKASAVKAVQDKLDAAVKQVPIDQATAVDAATGPLIAQISALTQQATDQKATLDKYDVLLAAKDAGPLADKLKKQAMVDTLTQQMVDAQATHDKAAADLAALEI